MIDLNVSDSLDGKFSLLRDLALDLKDGHQLLPPVYVISHKREKDVRTIRNFPFLKRWARVVVAEEERDRYVAANPEANILPIPSDWGGYKIGAGRAIQFCVETAYLLGQDRVLILDDDIISMTVLHAIEGGKVSQSFAKHLKGYGMNRDDYQMAGLALFSLLADEAFETHPKAMIASSQTNNPNRTVAASSPRWLINNGGNPGVARSWHVKRFVDSVGSIDLERFHRHGDDVGVALQVIESGGSIVKIPTIVAHGTDPETESVIRDPKTAPALRADEHVALMTMELGRYIKTRTDLLDRPQWHSLDWAALKRDGLAEDGSRLWEPTV